VSLLESIDRFVWGLPLIFLLLGTGLYLTIKLKFLQFRILIPSLRLALIERREREKADGDISHFQALMTALSATVGTGNIVGVATAISIGGPGAMFWIWMTGLCRDGDKICRGSSCSKIQDREQIRADVWRTHVLHIKGNGS
jgi:AGCS family alanine or glycine:cation symporter